jgi:hypothetical protein
MTEPYIANMAQDETEITEFAALLAAEGVTSYLEIGSKFGGSLWRVANALPKGSRIVAVDMPGGTKAWDQTRRSLKGCVHRLIELGYDARIIWGDSTDPRIIEQVQAHAPFDACLIDANHTLPYVTKDFANYGAISGRRSRTTTSGRKKSSAARPARTTASASCGAPDRRDLRLGGEVRAGVRAAPSSRRDAQPADRPRPARLSPG